MTQKELRQLRKEAAFRRRRIIFNNDGDDVYLAENPTPEALLAVRTLPLLDSQVDTLFYNTTQCYGLFSHNTHVGEVASRREGAFSGNITPDLIKQNTDALRIMIDFSHQNGKECFWSMRMNDTHDFDRRYFPQMKDDHPEFLFSTIDKPPKHGDWSGVDFTLPEIRELTFRFAAEVCGGYDIDGIDLDFFRHPVFFRKHAWGESLGAGERDMMTGMVRKIRTMTEEEGLRRGRPILVTARVPDSPVYAEAIGLDVNRWLEEELLDILLPGGYFQLREWEESVELGHKHGVSVYPCLSDSRMKGTARNGNTNRNDRNRLEPYRARAMNVWRSGADGVYMFNLFNPQSSAHAETAAFGEEASPNVDAWTLMREVGDPKELEKLSKEYFVAVKEPRSIEMYLRGGEKFMNLPSLCPENPETLKPGVTLTVPLRIGENVLWGQDQGVKPAITIMIHAAKLKKQEELPIILDGEALQEGIIDGEWIDFEVDPIRVKQGINNFRISNTGDNEVVLHDMVLKTAYA